MKQILVSVFTYVMGAAIATAQANTFPASGNVGVGTTTPAYPLHVSGNNPSILIQDTDTSGKMYNLSSRWGGYFTVFNEGQTDSPHARLAINPSGYFGVNITTPARRFHVYDHTGLGSGALIQAGYPFGAGVYPSILSLQDKDGTYQLFNVNSDGSFHFNRGPDRMLTGAANGNVGIGTAQPQRKLDVVVGDYDFISVGNPSAYQTSGKYNGISLGFVREDNLFRKTALVWESTGDGATRGKFHILQNNVPDSTNATIADSVFTVLPSGQIGVGTTNPRRRLDVVVGDHDFISVGNSTAYQTPGKYAGISLGFVRDDNLFRKTALVWESTGDGATRGKFHILQNNNPDTSNATVADAVFTVLPSGNVGIGTTSPTEKLAVNGTIRASEIRVDTAGADYVFADGYDLKPLNEVEQHIKQHKHLPGIPSAAEMQANGVGVADMQTKLLAKVEELTLHMIAQQKELAALKSENADLKSRLTTLESK